MGELVDRKDKYVIHVRGEDVVGVQRLTISADDRSVIQDIKLHGTLEEAHFYALGFIDGDANNE